MSAAIVTGGTKGIGLAISKALKEAGYDVAAVYHRDEEAAKTCAAAGIKTYKFDVGDFDACQSGCEQIAADLGDIDVLVNNAGITKDGMMHKMDADAWHAVTSTNLDSCFNMSRGVICGMRARSRGRIINISSINGQKGQFGQVNYAAAKAGILGFTKALALESAAKGITVNAICPGYIATDMTSSMKPEILDSIIRQIPVSRMGEPEEIADLVVFLASDKAGFITGATLTANGGQYLT